jgi:hypothetical protein
VAGGTPLVSATIRATPLGDPAKVVPAEVERAIHLAANLLLGEVRARTPIGATPGAGARSSIQLDIANAGGSMLARIGSPLAHVPVLEDGRRPGAKAPADPDGTFPARALVLWVRRKIRIETPRKRGEGTRQTAPTQDQAEAIAISIARAIAARGTKPLRMFAGAVEANRAKLDAIFAEAGMRIVTTITTRSG